MKICIINNLYPPYVRGGAEQVVVKTVEGLLAAGHEVVVITTAPQGQYRENNGRLTVYRYHPRNVFFYTDASRHPWPTRLLWHFMDIFHIPSMRYVESILRAEKPDVVHTHNLMGVSFLIPAMIRRLHIRHIHTIHDVQLVEPSGIIRKTQERSWRYTGTHVRLYSALMRCLLGSPSVVISPSQFLLNFYESRGFFPTAKRVVLRNPLTAGAVSVLHQPHEDIRFLYVGQIEEHKGVLFLARTFLSFAGSDAGKPTLHIAGNGSALPQLRDIAQDHPSIVIHGKVDRANLPALFASVDATIVPSLCYENSPTVIFESFAFGVPVIASSVEGIAELIQEGENGFTFPTENGAALIEKLQWCSVHMGTLREMSQKIVQSPVGLRQDEYVKELLSLYRS